MISGEVELGVAISTSEHVSPKSEICRKGNDAFGKDYEYNGTVCRGPGYESLEWYIAGNSPMFLNEAPTFEP